MLNWFKSLSRGAKLALGGVAIIAGTAIASQGSQVAPPTPPPAPKVTSSIDVVHIPIPFESQTVDDSAIDAGADTVVTEGVDGQKDQYWKVDSKDGKQTGRVLDHEVVANQPITKITHHGTKVAPPPPPPDPTAGATAKCRDGSLSYSQNRSGTCSHHGGVAIWY
jgi:hypothetical protein